MADGDAHRIEQAEGRVDQPDDIQRGEQPGGDGDRLRDAVVADEAGGEADDDPGERQILRQMQQPGVASGLMEGETAGPHEQQQDDPGHDADHRQQHLMCRPDAQPRQALGQRTLQRKADEPHQQQSAENVDHLDAKLEQKLLVLQQGVQAVGGLRHPNGADAPSACPFFTQWDVKQQAMPG